MTEAEAVERCEQFAAEHGLKFELTVLLPETEDEESRTITKSSAETLGAEWVGNSEQLTLATGNGSYSVGLTRILEEPAEIDAWFDLVRSYCDPAPAQAEPVEEPDTK
jgi:hypothetical protein